MAYINFQPNPKIPPIGFFQPISADPKDMMTDVEFLLGVVKKLNEIIAQLNVNTEMVQGWDEKIAELNAAFTVLENEFADFKGDVEQELADGFAQIRNETLNIINEQISIEHQFVVGQVNRLDTRIDNVAIGQINVYDPTTGIISPIQQVINNLYDSSRTDALTAEEFDELELTATAFDAYEITAFDFDNNGKSILV